MKEKRSLPPKRLLIVGGGFAGLLCAQLLGKRHDLVITLIDKRNFHLFQPLLYQVATGGLSPGDIAAPIRSVLKEFKNIKVRQGKVTDVEPQHKKVVLQSGERITYDYLLIATGVKYDYFGNPQWKQFSPGLKTVEDALEMRRRIFSCFEKAEIEKDCSARKALLTFVIVGGGPTGVELAGAIGELALNTLNGEFRNFDPAEVTVILIEGRDRLLGSFPESLSNKARQQLERLGVDVILNSFVKSIDEQGVAYNSDGSAHRIPAITVLWAAGVKASALGTAIAKKTKAELDGQGRVKVLPDLSVEGHPEVMIAGDLASLCDASGRTVPGVAPAAMQQGGYVAKRIAAILDKKNIEPFRYRNKGNLAVIGRNAAVAEIGPLRLSGIIAWLLWAIVHVYFLIDFGNKLVVGTQWVWNYLTKKRGARIITKNP
jgi:NADH dehydrogenase